MNKVDEILRALADGEWHPITEVAVNLRIDEPTAAMIFEFLAAYDFIEIDEKGLNAKVVPILQTFLKAIQDIERAEKWTKKTLKT